MDPILKIDDLYVSFDSYAGEVQAIRGVSFEVNEGEVLAVVGESGCGKSVTAQTIMKLNPMPPARIKSGSITLCGKDIVAASEKEMQDIRGQLVSMIFQDPMTCMNPTMKVGKQLTETLVTKKKITKAQAEQEAIRLLEMVQIPNAKERVTQYPHEFSGGMRQRAMIAMALACNPKLLIADEPTTALDVTIQAQIMKLMADIRKETKTAIILITHDLGVVASLADKVAVMYAGKVVEKGTVRDIFYDTCHPYTLALLKSLPTSETKKEEELVSIPGTPPDLYAPPKGCAFASRCEVCMKICKENQPPVFEVGKNHTVSCWRFHKDFKRGKEE
ncbi:MAG: ABC transporter ATP-binding protein [Firmicutes bacterium]|uniref:ABC transporter ATP-binding protein n=1 Tax=Candidatus Scybalomonas excrementavium TaxID=2840943 RepID=A0A9D9HZJ7_9FIRM|nr:ABC transporter ATP-binding protein [Candidatus Scybalomonas excrementavium]